MTGLSLLLFQNGLTDLPVVLVEPHRNHGAGIWRIKFSYDADQHSRSAPNRHRRWQPISIKWPLIKFL
jgi:hypothetical protein